jgi:hypothetical protein
MNGHASYTLVRVIEGSTKSSSDHVYNNYLNIGDNNR